jgi:hypothetical protein
MTINLSFVPGVDFTGTYTVVVYKSTNKSLPIGQVSLTGPFGASVAATVSNVPSAPVYTVKIFTPDCEEPVGQVDVVNPQ